MSTYIYVKEASNYFCWNIRCLAPQALNHGKSSCLGTAGHRHWMTSTIYQGAHDSLSLKMLFFFLLTYALWRSIEATPLASPSSSNEIQFRDVPTCDCSNAPSQRSLFDIIWGCIVTLFACTWISVHPNVPSLSDSYLTILGRRVKVMIYALIVPEGVMYWAMRQWLGSRKLARRYKGQSPPRLWIMRR